MLKPIKKITLLLILNSAFCILNSFAQTYNAPESVVYDSANSRYFISNNGANQILARDASGTLSVFTSAITTGPNGLEIIGNTLFACDGASMKGFDLTTAAVVMNLNVGATFLNGICTDGTNYLYATDFTAKKIFKIDIAAQTFTVFVTGLVKSPNGIIYDSANNRIVWVTWGTSAPVMQALLSDSSVSQVTATTLGNCDGIVRDGNGNYYVSAWSTQSVYRFDNLFAAAPVAVVTGLSNPADIYYNLADDTLASPNSGNSTVTFHYMGAATVVDEAEAGMELKVFPNPVTNEIRVQSSKFKVERVKIYDVLGQLHNSAFCILNFELIVNVSSLSPGIYFLKLKGEGEERIARFVKQ
ncbi:MAG TPA: T9SS type A sorting domain-containing protein [Bacteroidia bacterium]|nr:T9SS type A sorting domain-containing protein [Bacteroidia bacterium]